MIGTEERDYERIEPSIRGIGYQEGEREKAHDGAGRNTYRARTIRGRDTFQKQRKARNK